jgi:hypothetical protein
VHNQTFNVGDDAQNYRIREIAEVVGKVFDGSTVTMGKPGGDNRSYRTSFAKIRRHLPEFQCQWTAERGARQLYRTFRRIGMTKDMFQFRGFTRVEQLKHLIATRQIDADFFWLPPDEQMADGRPG